MRKWLSDLRKEHGLTQEQVAEKLEITSQAYYYIEHGQRQKDMSLTFMNSLSKIFGISLDYIKEMEIKNDDEEGLCD